MKQTFLPDHPLLVQRQIKTCRLCCIAAVVLAAGLNILLTVLHTRQTHTVMLILNIVIDLAALWFAVWGVTAVILPLNRLLRLDKQTPQTVSGTVEEISALTERYLGFDCRIASVSGQKVFVIENGRILLREGEAVIVETVSGIVREVREC